MRQSGRDKRFEISISDNRLAVEQDRRAHKPGQAPAQKPAGNRRHPGRVHQNPLLGVSEEEHGSVKGYGCKEVTLFTNIY